MYCRSLKKHIYKINHNYIKHSVPIMISPLTEI